MRKTLLIAVFALCVCQSLSARPAAAATGEWIGGSDLFGTPVFLHVVLPSNGKGGVINSQAWRMLNRPVAFRGDGNLVHMEVVSTTGTPYIFDGELKDGVITGTASRGDQKGKFHLVQVASVDRSVYDRYVGAYDFPDPKSPGQTQASLITYGALGHLRWVNLVTGDTMGLFPVSKHKFVFVASVIQGPDPTLMTWTFVDGPNGTPASAIVQVKGQPDQTGPRLGTIHQERVSLISGGHKIAGTLVKPVSKDPVAAIVFAPGSNAISRDESAPFAEFDTVLRTGTALLIYDKKGTGESEGSWQEESFTDLANDALAAVNYLKARKDIDKKKIGIWGVSQGASVAPLAATMSRDVSFVIMSSGGGVTNEEAEMGDQIARMQRAKLTDEEIQEAIAFMKLQFQAAYSEAGWKAFQEAIPGATGKRWLPRTWARIPKDDWWWRFWKMNGRFDLASVLKKVTIPVLATLGGSDELVPAGKIKDMAEAIKADLAHNRDVTVRIFPDANHNLTVQNAEGRWVPTAGYHEVLSQWLRTRVGAKER